MRPVPPGENSQRGVFETAGPDGKRAREGDRGAMATVRFAAMTGVLLAGWMAVRAKRCFK